MSRAKRVTGRSGKKCAQRHCGAGGTYAVEDDYGFGRFFCKRHAKDTALEMLCSGSVRPVREETIERVAPTAAMGESSEHTGPSAEDVTEKLMIEVLRSRGGEFRDWLNSAIMQHTKMEAVLYLLNGRLSDRQISARGTRWNQENTHRKIWVNRGPYEQSIRYSRLTRTWCLRTPHSPRIRLPDFQAAMFVADLIHQAAASKLCADYGRTGR